MNDPSPQFDPATTPASNPLNADAQELLRRRLEAGSGKRGLLGRIIEHSWAPPVFLALTIASVLYAGLTNGSDFYEQLGVKTTGLTDPLVVRQGLIFTVALFAILGTHEMGHWIVSKLHHVKTSLPVFIPLPFGPIGTFGAVISMKELPRTRSAFLRIGAAGPLAGGVVALVVMGLALPTCPALPAASVAAAPAGSYTLVFGSSLGMRLLEFLAGTHVVDADNVLASPLFMAAWTGFLITSINLFPVGQLDGGHVAYAIFGPVMNRLAKPIAVAVIGLVVFGSFSYVAWGLLLFFVLSWHPPVPEPEAKLPLDAWILAIASVVLFVLTFMVAPLKLVKAG